MNSSYDDRGPCAECGLIASEGPRQGYDPCLGRLPGVAHACCGHGGRCQPYVCIGGAPDQPASSIECGMTLRGADALAFFELCRNATERWDGDYWEKWKVIDLKEVFA